VIVFGIILTAIAILFAEQTQLLWEAFKWASLIAGSMLGIFLLGVLTRTRGDDHINPVVMLLGVAMLAALKFKQDSSENVYVAWPWWIVIGTVWTFGVGALFRSSPSAQNRANTAVV
jgi:hypothetical protein